MHPSELTPELLLRAYANGFFPMPEPQTNEILWYNPDPRAIIPLDGFKPSRSLLRSITKRGWRFTINQDFSGVMRACAARPETWINDDFVRIYGELHRLGFAHSVEVWAGARLVGGVYGVSIAGAFFAESKFHLQTDASKAALNHLISHMRQQQMQLLEVQFLTPHLATLGAKAIPSAAYMRLLHQAMTAKVSFNALAQS